MVRIIICVVHVKNDEGIHSQEHFLRHYFHAIKQLRHPSFFKFRLQMESYEIYNLSGHSFLIDFD